MMVSMPMATMVVLVMPVPAQVNAQRSAPWTMPATINEILAKLAATGAFLATVATHQVLPGPPQSFQ